jgi:hypothetical protein
MLAYIKHLTAAGFALALAVVVGLFIPSLAAAQDPPMTFNERIPFESSGAPLCGGEEVTFSGTMHILTHVTVDEQGGSHSVFHTNFQNTSATGLTTGTKYVINESSTFAFNTRELPTEFTQTINGNLIGQGPAGNTGFHLTVHVTINANGEPTSEVINESIRCNG